MKTEISRDSHQTEKCYSGVYQKQGRMLTDSDWNELVEILKDRLNDALKDVVGSKAGSAGGTPRHRALKIVDAPGDTFEIQPGHVYADGIAARILGDSNIVYNDQPYFPSPPPPAGNYVLYADVWERTVTHLVDERLRDKGLHGADTCSRKQSIAQIKWGPYNASAPENPDNNPEISTKNPVKGDAKLSLTLLHKTTNSDPCDPCAAELDVESKTGNYLFRVEVHDVRGDADGATKITLKWSSENGAEQFEALPTKDAMPGGFISDKWVYEFFDETSERHLGVHLDTSWDPVRGVLTEINEATGSYAVPAIPGSNETFTLVRRWDGYCKLNLSSKTLIEGVDRGVTLTQSRPATSLGDVAIRSSLEIILKSIRLDLDLDASAFVAGDFWLADVREAEHDPLDAVKSKLIENQAPQGIEHHFLTLGKMVAGGLKNNPEIDRKYAFPPLTEMTRMFHLGGDGQEAMPNHFVPQSLKVGVANGEWPVAGAKVEFTVTNGDGKLEAHPDFALENFDPGNPITGIATTDGVTRRGWANCRWVLGATDRKQRVKVRLVDPDSDPLDAVYPRYLDHPPIHFYANLSTADQVAYDNPVCAGTPTVNLLFAEDTGVTWPDFDGDEDITVKDVLDALLCELKASHIPYDEPSCAESPSVKSLLSGLDFNSDGHLTAGDVLDTLLCKLKAEHVPYDPVPKDARWADINDDPGRPETVQQAIDDLAENLESTDIRYEVPECGDATSPTVRTGLEILPGTHKIDEILDKLLCDFKATDLPVDRSADLCVKLQDDSTVKTVQDALNVICRMERGGGCAVTVGKNGQFETLLEAFEALKEEMDLCICLLPGEHLIDKPLALKNKQGIKISGCGSRVSKVLIDEIVSLEASEVVLRDLSFYVGKKIGETSESGSLELSGVKTGQCSVENCLFWRVFRGRQIKWKPLVTVKGSMLLDWRGNKMFAIRQDEKLSKAILPKEAELSGPSREAYLLLKEVLDADPFDPASEFERKVESAAEKFVSLSSQARTKFFDARFASRIDQLGTRVVDTSGSSRIMLGEESTLVHVLIESTTESDPALLAVRTRAEVSPKTAVVGLYDDIKSASAADLEKIIDRIKAVATLFTSVDDALSLSDGGVGGNVYENVIRGHVVLFGGLNKGVELDWGLTDEGQQGRKKAWADKTQYFVGFGILNIHDNTITAVHSMVLTEALDELKDILDANPLTPKHHFEGYDSLSVHDNLFIGLESSFAAAKLRFSGNEFRAGFDKGDVVAYAMGYLDLFNGNLASNTEAVLEQVSKKRQEAANLLLIA